MKGKLIVIEGTNSSGKETQAKLLYESLNKKGIKCELFKFPNYNTPTGKIIYNNLSEKKNNSVFEEGFKNIPPKVAALYYAADRAYNIEKINELLNQGINVILDRYVESNMAYQAAKLDNINDKIKMILWLEQLEFCLLELPRPDKVIFLYLPYEFRNDKNEYNEHLKNIEEVYRLLAERYYFDIITTVWFDKKIKTIEEVHSEINKIVEPFLNQ